MPEVQQLYLQKPEGVAVLAIGNGTPERIASIRESKGLTLPVPQADQPWLEGIGVTAFPETFFLDTQGRVAEHLQGPQDLAYFQARVDALLAEAAGAQVATAPAVSSEHSRLSRFFYWLTHGRPPSR